MEKLHPASWPCRWCANNN